MELQSFTELLHNLLSKDSRILTNENDLEFNHALSRWSDLDVETPSAIIQPVTEADAVATVRYYETRNNWPLLTRWHHFMNR